MKKLVFAMSLFVAVFLFASCGKDSEVQIGIVLPTKDEPRWVQDEARFKAILDDKGYSYEIKFSQGNTAKELENVEALLTKEIEVLIICPHDGDGAKVAVEKAKADGVKVISYDRLLTNTDAVDYYVTFNSVAVGEAQGQYLIDQLDGTKGHSLYLYAGASTDNNAFLFFEGAWKVLQPKIADGTFIVKNSQKAIDYKDKATLTRDEKGDIIGQTTTLWSPVTAKELAEANITSEAPSGKTYILAPNDGTARAIYDEFAKTSGLTIYITGQDAEKASIQYVIDNKQSMTVFKDVRELGKAALKMAEDILEGRTPVTNATYNNESVDVKSIDIAVITVTSNNVVEKIFDSEYYDKDEFDNVPTS